MKIKIFTILLVSVFNIFKSQDLDKDGILDTVIFDKQKNKIICKLSTQKFKPIISKQVETYGNISGIRKTKNGFEFFVNFMRAGFANQFYYDKKEKKIRLIGMSRYEYGPASNDGSGKSSINLLTNNYIGEWNHYSFKKNDLIKMKPIRTKMYFPKIFLESYDDRYQEEFEEKCVSLYLKHKEKYKNF